MPIAWYVVPYKRRAGLQTPSRYPAIDDYTAQIVAAGGRWAETEVLGDRCLVKVRATTAILQTLGGVYKRLPKNALNTSLSDLSQAAKRALRDEMLDMGYTLDEIRERFGDDLGAYTLGDVLRFMARRRKKPRWDRENDAIVFDGEDQPCRPVDDVDGEIV